MIYLTIQVGKKLARIEYNETLDQILAYDHERKEFAPAYLPNCVKRRVRREASEFLAGVRKPYPPMRRAPWRTV